MGKVLAVTIVVDQAAGCAVAAFGTFFSMPWRLLFEDFLPAPE